MAPKNRTVRFKLYALLSLPIVALIALWTYVAFYVVGNAFELLRVQTVSEQVAAPSATLASMIKQERKLSAIYLSERNLGSARLEEARQRTDAAIRLFHQRSTSQEASSALDAETRAAIDEIHREFPKLTAIRNDVDARAVDRVAIVAAYSEIQNVLYRMYDRLITVPDIRLYQKANGVYRIAQAGDLLSREDALLSGAALDGTLSRRDYEAVAEAVANRRLLMRQGLSVLDRELSEPYERLMASTDYRRLEALEQQGIVRRGLPGPTDNWQPLIGTIGASLDRLVADHERTLGDRADDSAGILIAQIVIAGGLGLVAVLAAVILSARFGRSLARELADLRSAAIELADVRLPRLVRKLRRGETVDVDAEAPPINTGATTLEVLDVGQALSTVRRTAVQAAVGQAELRRGVSQVFRNLARRNQSLLHRQLTQLDAMQRKTTDPKTLQDLFRLDHLTTRMRRQAEGLIILSGAPAGRAWRKPVPILDVVRGAVAEVEDYTRVVLTPMPDAALIGSAVTDVIHLLAELIENATVFSPPHTQVQVRAELVGRGIAIEIEDRGLGLGDAEREELNRRLENPPEFDLADSDRLGLFVVSQLAMRHNVKVTLRRSPYGGTTAVVLIPQSVVAEEEPGTTRDSRARSESATGSDTAPDASAETGRENGPETGPRDADAHPASNGAPGSGPDSGPGASAEGARAGSERI
jgi:Histidine kinase-, DNA gyrase B-, and HSP90-like ATPase./Nitrate and nitrite sensing.